MHHPELRSLPYQHHSMKVNIHIAVLFLRSLITRLTHIWTTPNSKRLHNVVLDVWHFSECCSLFYRGRFEMQSGKPWEESICKDTTSKIN